MLNTIRNYIKDESFYLVISNNFFYIKGYKKIYEINSNTVLIEIDRMYKIKGKNFKLVKKLDDEIKVLGIIEGINIT